MGKEKAELAKANRLSNRLSKKRSNLDGFGQLGVHVVPAVLDGDHAAALPVGDDGDGLATETAQGKQETVSSSSSVRISLTMYSTPSCAWVRFMGIPPLRLVSQY